MAGYLNNRTITIDDNGGGTSTRDGVAIAGSTGFTVTTNDAASSDRLSQFIVSGGTFNTLDYVNQQITDLKAQITTRGLAIPADPATAADGSQARQDLRDALNLAASQSELLASLAGLYETKLALAGSTARNAVVVGGTIVPSIEADGTTRYGVSSNGGVFAAGGRVTLTTDSFVGGRAANVTANSGGVVTIVNRTGYDTIVGNVFVPFKVNGVITYDGKAQALLGNVTSHLPTGSNTDGVVSVTSGTASTRSDVIVLGVVQNVSGAFKAVTAGAITSSSAKSTSRASRPKRPPACSPFRRRTAPSRKVCHCRSSTARSVCRCSIRPSTDTSIPRWGRSPRASISPPISVPSASGSRA